MKIKQTLWWQCAVSALLAGVLSSCVRADVTRVEVETRPAAGDVFSRDDLNGTNPVIGRDAGGKADTALIDAVGLSPEKKRDLPLINPTKKSRRPLIGARRSEYSGPKRGASTSRKSPIRNARATRLIKNCWAI